MPGFKVGAHDVLVAKILISERMENKTMTKLPHQRLESHLLKIVDEIRGKMDASEFKEFIALKEKTIFNIQDRTKYYQGKIGVTPKSIKVMAPLSIVDYIIVHELCHLHHPNHSNAFWNEVDKALPDYRKRRDWLRTKGTGLEIDLLNLSKPE